jgi:hypothetical protein
VYGFRKVVPQLKRLVAGFSPPRSGFDPGPNHVELGQVFSEYFGFPCHSFIHSSPTDTKITVIYNSYVSKPWA